MTVEVSLLPCRRAELLIKPFGDGGQYVVKDPHTEEFFHLGPEEHFLLVQLDGQKEPGAICSAFEKELGQPLSVDELTQFVEMARRQGFLRESAPLAPRPAPSTRTRRRCKQLRPAARRGVVHRHRDSAAPPPSRPKKQHQSILYWRKNLFDPDRLLNWLHPRIRFFWSRGFLLLSALCIVAALIVFWTGRAQAASSFVSSLRWETVFWVWLTIFAVTMLHEFAHGLTCKHFGGEVHEIGFLLMYFMPCFYCNVSDAWLFKEKSKRLWVTFAGGYFELFLWALAVFVWRLTVPGSMLNYLAFVVLASCGIQSLFNFNPLIKLDGYYFLSDWLEVPNLRQRGLDRFKGHCRRLLWGAARPPRERRGRVLFVYGVLSFWFSLTLLGFMLLAMGRFTVHCLGWLGVLPIAYLGLVSYRGLLSGLCAGEVRKMFLWRHKRLALWLLLVAAAAASLFVVPVEDRVSGPFQVRSSARVEIRAPVAGFINEVMAEEGDRVNYGATLVRLEVPDLDSRRAQKQAAIQEVQARLKLLLVGARPEEVAKQKELVEQAGKLLEQAEKDLQRLQTALAAQLKQLEHKIAQHKAEVDATDTSFKNTMKLNAKNAATPEQLSLAKRDWLVSQELWKQALAEKTALTVKGTYLAEQEEALRAKELAEAQAGLKLLEAGSRPEEIDAEKAHLARLQEEARYLEQLEHKRTLTCPIAGIITTPRLREKAGQFVREGDLIAVIEEPAVLEAEITVTEDEAALIRLGQPVELKVRACPFDTLTATVNRIESTVRGDEGQRSLIVICRLSNADGLLRAGMSGHARIYTEQCCLGEFLVLRVLRFLRTEFWW